MNFNINSDPLITVTSSQLEGVELKEKKKDTALIEEYGFDFLTARLTPEVKLGLENKLDEIKKDPNVQKAVNIIKEFDYLESRENIDLFVSPDFDLYAIEAVRQKFISRSQLASALSFKSSLFLNDNLPEQRKISINDLHKVPLFYDASPSPQARAMIKMTLQKYGKMKSDHITAQELDTFFTEMSKLPESAQSFIILPDTRNFKNLQNHMRQKSEGKKFDSNGVSISQILNRIVYFNVLSSFVNKHGDPWRMIPSFEMIEILNKIMHKENALTPNIVLGLSSRHDLRNAMKHGIRDIALPNSVVSLVSEEELKSRTGPYRGPRADEYDGPGYDWIYHEIYHLFTGGFVPKEVRSACFDLNENILDKVKLSPDSSDADKSFADDLDGFLTDQEFLYYNKTIENDPLAFWHEFKEIFKKLLVALPSQRWGPDKGPRDVFINDVCISFAKSSIIPRIVEYFSKPGVKEKWKETSNIDLNDLNHLCEEILDSFDRNIRDIDISIKVNELQLEMNEVYDDGHPDFQKKMKNLNKHIETLQQQKADYEQGKQILSKVNAIFIIRDKLRENGIIS